MKNKASRLAFAIVALSLAMTVLSVGFHRFNPAVVGNLCDVSNSNPMGYCYRALPAGGLPLSYDL